MTTALRCGTKNEMEKRWLRPPSLTSRTLEVRVTERLMPILSVSDKERFSRKFVVKPGDCWTWTGAVNSCGYGSFGIAGKMYGAHQIALLLRTGQRPPAPANHALHSCDNPRCVNPSHLRWGTHQQNMIDRKERKRGNITKGMRPRARLSIEQVVFVKNSSLSGLELAEMLNVHKATISDIRCGKTWQNL